MKKIITLLGLLVILQNGFAKMAPYGAYFNYTQNTGAGGYWSVNNYITANPGDSIVFDAYYSITPSMPPQYPMQWYLEGNPIPWTAGDEFLPIIVNQSGTYRAHFNGMWDDDIYFHVNNITGIATLPNINFLNVFPTVVTSSITIQLHSIKTNDVEISFFDMNGKQLKTGFYKNIVGEFIKNENTEALAKGMYFLRIKSGDDVMEKKFVKL